MTMKKIDTSLQQTTCLTRIKSTKIYKNPQIFLYVKKKNNTTFPLSPPPPPPSIKLFPPIRSFHVSRRRLRAAGSRAGSGRQSESRTWSHI